VAQAQQEVKKAEEQLYVDDEKFASLQEEVDEKTKKLEKLRKRLKSSLKEVQDLQSEFQDERDDFLETIRSAERELKLYTAIAQRHVSPDMLAMYEEQSTWDDDTEEWILPKAPRGMEQAGAAGGKPPKPRKKPTENADMPPSDIGKASPTSAEDAGYAADIMGDGSGSDDEFENYGNGGNYMQATRGSRGSSSAGSGRMNRSGGPSTFNEDVRRTGFSFRCWFCLCLRRGQCSEKCLACAGGGRWEVLHRCRRPAAAAGGATSAQRRVGAQERDAAEPRAVGRGGRQALRRPQRLAGGCGLWAAARGAQAADALGPAAGGDEQADPEHRRAGGHVRRRAGGPESRVCGGAPRMRVGLSLALAADGRPLCAGQGHGAVQPAAGARPTKACASRPPAPAPAPPAVSARPACPLRR